VIQGVIRVGSRLPLPRRLQAIYLGVRDVIQAHTPQGVAVESIFHAQNARSSLILGQARGVILLAAVQLELEVYEYTPRQVKQALTGYGNAGKHQLRAMVKSLLGIEGAIALDASDALAVAICHAHSLRMDPRSGALS
jgi:crossover junction endodeoxyribonuclease RuvC